MAIVDFNLGLCDTAESCMTCANLWVYLNAWVFQKYDQSFV